MFLLKHLVIFCSLLSLSFAQEYNFKLIVDKNSKKYLSEIKRETRILFPSVDKITYETRV